MPIRAAAAKRDELIHQILDKNKELNSAIKENRSTVVVHLLLGELKVLHTELGLLLNNDGENKEDGQTDGSNLQAS